MLYFFLANAMHALETRNPAMAPTIHAVMSLEKKLEREKWYIVNINILLERIYSLIYYNFS